MSALGHKRTFCDVRFSLNDVRFTLKSGHVSAYDPKRTWAGVTPGLSSVLV